MLHVVAGEARRSRRTSLEHDRRSGRAYLNDQWVGTYPADSETTVPIAGHGGPPWSVTAEDRTGNVHANAIVSVEDAAGLASGERVVESSGTVGCGLVRIMAGTAEAVAQSIPQDGDDPACP